MARRNRSFSTDISRCVKALHEDPSGFQVLELALLSVQSSSAIYRYHELLEAMENWLSDSSGPLTYFLANPDVELPNQLVSEYPIEARRLQLLKAVFGPAVARAKIAFNTPLSLLGVRTDLEANKDHCAELVFVRADGKQFPLELSATQLSKLTADLMDMMSDYLNAEGTLDKKDRNRLRNSLARLLSVLDPRDTNGEVVVTSE